MFEKALTKALSNFFASSKGQEIIGNIMLRALSISLTRTVQIEDGKTEPGKKVVKEENINVLDHLIKYMPYVEAALRGVQVDADVARNRSVQVLQEVGDIKQIFADQLEKRNTVDSETLAKAIVLAQSQMLRQLSMEDVKQIGENNNNNHEQEA